FGIGRVVVCPGFRGGICQTRRQRDFYWLDILRTGRCGDFPDSPSQQGKADSLSRAGLSRDAAVIRIGRARARRQCHLCSREGSPRVHLSAGGVGPHAARIARLFFFGPPTGAGPPKTDAPTFLWGEY